MDKKTVEEQQARKEKLVDVALAAYITAHCGELKHKSPSVVGKILVEFAKAAYASETDDLPELGMKFSPQVREGLFNTDI